MKKTALWLILWLGVTQLYGQEVYKFGYVDVEEVFRAHTGSSEVKAKINAQKQNFQNQINKRKEEIAQLEIEYQKNYGVLNDSERTRRETEIQYKKELLSEFIDDSNKKLIALRNDLTKPIYLKIASIIQKVADEKGYSFVFRKGSEGLLYFNKKYDITADVKTRLIRELELERR